MAKKVFFLIIFISFFYINNLYIYSSWDADDAWHHHKSKTVFASNQKTYLKPIYNFFPTQLFYGIIKFYQNHLKSEHSFGRCPSYPSCSRYTLLAIYQYGFFFGSIMFIDRTFIRENIDMYKYYRMVSIDHKQKYYDTPYNNFIFNQIYKMDL